MTNTSSNHTAETRILWIDVETTGLNLHETDKLLQVAAIITDGDFNEIAEPFEAKVRFENWQVGMMKNRSKDVVREMHEKTGLWDSLKTSGITLPMLDDRLAKFIDDNSLEGKQPYFGGNSIFLDRTALMLNLPKAFSKIHYRSIDMSSIAIYMGLTTDAEPFEKSKSHDALDDIRESIAEAKYYRDLLK